MIDAYERGMHMLKQFSIRYYSHDESVIPDTEYDRLRFSIHNLESMFLADPYLKEYVDPYKNTTSLWLHTGEEE